MNKRGRELKKAVASWAEEHGVTEYVFSTGGSSHQYVEVRGRKFFFPNTPSDNRAVLNCRAEFRRWLKTPARTPIPAVDR